jgi:peptidoglycan/LPS O-acetylase OafA/YrhL
MDEIRPLTSMRGFAALAVVMQHFSATAQTLTPNWIPSLVPHGYMAVDFFFILSGYIMCLTYLSAFEAGGMRAYPGFLLKRVARIVPLNVFVLLVLMALGIISRAVLSLNVFFNDSSIAFDLPANLLMLQGLGIGRNLNGPSWSISTEFAAYFLFPVFIFLVFHRMHLVKALPLLIALAVMIAMRVGQPRFGLLADGPGDQVKLCFAEFVLGMGSYIWYEYRRVRRVRRGRAGDVEVGFYFAAIASGLITGIDLAVALLCPFVVVAMALNRGVFARLLSGGVPYFLGVVSYSIYLIHDPCRLIAARVFTAIHPAPVGPFGALLFAFVASLAIVPLAWFTFIAVERPGRRVIRRWAESAVRRYAMARTVG